MQQLSITIMTINVQMKHMFPSYENINVIKKLAA